MPQRQRRQVASIATKTAELAFAVPQVIAHRVTRMALAGPSPSARDRAEFQRMVNEKPMAFTQSFWAMGFQTMAAVQSMALSAFYSAFSFGLSGRHSSTDVLQEAQAAAWRIVGKTIEPIHARATANARRLSNTRIK